jgi:hypothetical protein
MYPVEQMLMENLDGIFLMHVFTSVFLTRALVPIFPASGSIVFTAFRPRC